MQDHATESGARDTPHVAHNAAMEAESAARPPVPVMALLSFATLTAGLAIAFLFGAGVTKEFSIVRFAGARRDARDGLEALGRADRRQHDASSQVQPRRAVNPKAYCGAVYPPKS
jgi:hypothetical protein